MEAIAKHDFIPAQDSTNELAFKRDDKLLILNYGDPVLWYDAELNQRRGLVPGNYVSVEKADWYMGRISRTRAEQLLLCGNQVDGAFVVRLSESSPNDFSLSVRCGQSVQHFRILKNEHSRYFLWSQAFYSLNELVKFYRTQTVSRTSDIKLRDRNLQERDIVEAIYDFTPQPDADGDTELGFRIGDLITVFDRSDENWWGGSLNGREGYFPRTYVKDYQSSERGDRD